MKVFFCPINNRGIIHETLVSGIVFSCKNNWLRWLSSDNINAKNTFNSINCFETEIGRGWSYSMFNTCNLLYFTLFIRKNNSTVRNMNPPSKQLCKLFLINHGRSLSAPSNVTKDNSHFFLCMWDQKNYVMFYVYETDLGIKPHNPII